MKFKNLVSRMDPIGLSIFTLGFALIEYNSDPAFTSIIADKYPPGRIAKLTIGLLFAFPIFIVWELYGTSFPLMPRRVLQRKGMLFAIMINFLFWLASIFPVAAVKDFMPFVLWGCALWVHVARDWDFTVADELPASAFTIQALIGFGIIAVDMGTLISAQASVAHDDLATVTALLAVSSQLATSVGNVVGTASSVSLAQSGSGSMYVPLGCLPVGRNKTPWKVNPSDPSHCLLSGTLNMMTDLRGSSETEFVGTRTILGKYIVFHPYLGHFDATSQPDQSELQPHVIVRLARTTIAMTFARYLIRLGHPYTLNSTSNYRKFHSTSKLVAVSSLVPVPVRSDNYAYLLIDEATKKAAAVDPFDVPKVQAQAEKEGVELAALITTHHHPGAISDHSGGNKEFHSAYPDAPVYGGSDNVPALTHRVKDGDTFSVGENIKVESVPTVYTRPSTQTHIPSWSGAWLPRATRRIRFVIMFRIQFDQNKKESLPGMFTEAETKSGSTSIRTAPEMHKALSYLGALPDETVVYNGHEYTKASLAFGAHIDPDAPGMNRLRELAEEKVTTGKSTIADEKQWNVFMRLDSEAVRQATKAQDDVEAMAKLQQADHADRGLAVMGEIPEWKWDIRTAPRIEADYLSSFSCDSYGISRRVMGYPTAIIRLPAPLGYCRERVYL
ncbi:hydroxyacylglutathione hydrolase [Rhizoctonia solani AG-1 IA]|uniref:hydroxyacylglutathione hydrolase n=1 Tax=Thanatephorus cucumeris (strain AG1-IA) TaxID=983506 RepID=L8X1R3_THACA|nr:hydroxyacylglutathione hydrolase [Rhizoctonia solani AG-1 IA]